jgi:alanine racemase
MLIETAQITTNSKIILTDSRFLSDPASSIFFAIKGERHNGHQFIHQLFEKGIKEFVVEKDVINSDIALKDFLEKSELKAFVVQNSIKALQNLATEKRRQFKYPVIGITGSNGKTIVKEWLHFLLEQEFEIVKSPRSYNSQIGVALSVWEMNEKSNLGIFEAGISLQNEMQNLEAIIKPEIGIFTNIGPAHNEGFKSLKQKITEKLRLFKTSKVLVYSKDYKEINEELVILLKAVNPNIQLISWSRNRIGENWVETQITENGTLIEINWLGDSYNFEIPFTDHASIENALHCAYTGLYLNSQSKINLDAFFEKFKSLRLIAMRLELKQGTNDNYIIDDTYNNDLGGLKMALNFMSQHHTKRQKVLIVSDILQSGLQEGDLLQSLGDLIKSQNISVLIGIGSKFFQKKEFFSSTSKVSSFFYENTTDFLSLFNFENLNNSLILVKGARSFAFEKIVNKLVMKVHGTVFEVNLDSLTSNLNYYRNKMGNQTKIMVMVKAFAYGSGSMEVASWLQYHRVDYLSVAYPDEGVVLRQNGIKLPIMVLNADPETYHKLFEYDLEPEIYSLRTLKEYLHFKTNLYSDSTSKIHLKLDTGMHRLGFIEEDLETLVEQIHETPNVEIASIFSHLVGADEAEHIDFSKRQIVQFDSLSSKIIAKLNYKPLRHICNSAGIIRFPEAKYDMVRLGIGLYGIESSGIEPNALEVVGTLKTTISQIKTLSKGETVGYSRKGIIEKESKIATLAIGYADGYDRGFSRGVGQVLVNDVLCPVVGNVCMDMTMIDVSNTTCKEGDQVVMFGKKPNIKDLAAAIGTIPYELLTGVSERVKRVFYHE